MNRRGDARNDYRLLTKTIEAGMRQMRELEKWAPKLRRAQPEMALPYNSRHAVPPYGDTRTEKISETRECWVS